MDRDGDGRISLVEDQDWMSYAFDGMDHNRDGTLTPDELPGGKGKPVTREGYRARIAATFNKQDVDRDGTLDARELAAPPRSEEHTSELQSLMRISYAVFCLKHKKN